MGLIPTPLSPPEEAGCISFVPWLATPDPNLILEEMLTKHFSETIIQASQRTTFIWLTSMKIDEKRTAIAAHAPETIIRQEARLLNNEELQDNHDLSEMKASQGLHQCGQWQARFCDNTSLS